MTPRGRSDWTDFTPSRPIPVSGGLVARSTRGGIGEQWWSRRFLEVMESFALGGRLTRGRAYARKGQVISLVVEPGQVAATVQGSRVTPYQVRIGLAKFTELTWAKAEVLLAEQAIHSARLLAGEFPPELEPVFAGIGAPLFPGRLADLTMSCSCPDHAVPCKHLAAAFYLLAERFDDDPFLLLRWRGRPREALLDRLRELRTDIDQPGSGDPSRARSPLGSGDPSGSGGLGEPGLGVGDGQGGSPPLVISAALALRGTDLDTSPHLASTATGQVADTENAVASFWTAGRTPVLPTHPELPVDLVLRSLPAPGTPLGGSRLLAHLGRLYSHLPPADPGPTTPGSKANDSVEHNAANDDPGSS